MSWRAPPAILAALVWGGCEPRSLEPEETYVAATETWSASRTASVVKVPSSLKRDENRGLWLWEFEKNGPSAAEAAAIARELGFSRVFIKSNNGQATPRWTRNVSEENLRPFRDEGLEIWLFGYMFPEGFEEGKYGSIEAQARTGAEAANLEGVTGFIVDAEEEFKGRPDDATRLCKAIRSQIGARRLGYTSFGWLRSHPTFPFQAFDAHCGDVFIPQVYSSFGWPGGFPASLERLRRDVSALGLRAPIWIAQSNERDPSTAELATFFDLAGPNASLFYLHPPTHPTTRTLSRWYEESRKESR